jgi:uncharacterized protein (DUF2141 family)
MLIPTITWAQSEQSEGFTVAGEVTFTKTGDITLRLMTEEQYKKSREPRKGEERNSEEKKGGHDYAADKDVTGFLILKVSPKELEQKKVAFVFTRVPEGVYAIEGYQDANGDGLLNTKWYGPATEPHGNYRPSRPKLRDAKFKEMAFEVTQDITDIVVEMK